MASLDDLPNELVGLICNNLSRSDILSLRLVSKQFPAKTMDHYLALFKEKVVTCSPDGLDRLQTLANLPDESSSIKEKVKHVTIHGMTVKNLQELADAAYDEEDGDGYVPAKDQHLNAYKATRFILLKALNELPKLESIVMLSVEPNTGWDTLEGTKGMDPLRPGEAGLLRGFECALSIMPALNNQNLTLHLKILYSAEQRAADVSQPEPFQYDSERNHDRDRFNEAHVWGCNGDLANNWATAEEMWRDGHWLPDHQIAIAQDRFTHHAEVESHRLLKKCSTRSSPS